MNAQRMGGGQNDYLAMLNSPDYGNIMSPSEEETNEYVNSPRAAGSGHEG